MAEVPQNKPTISAILASSSAHPLIAMVVARYVRVRVGPIAALDSDKTKPEIDRFG